MPDVRSDKANAALPDGLALCDCMKDKGSGQYRSGVANLT